MGTSSGFRSEAMSFRYFGGTPVFAGPGFGIHPNPDSSGLPSGARGAGAERLGLPSAARGTFVCLTFSHCAKAGVAHSIPTISQCDIFICSPYRSRPVTAKGNCEIGRILHLKSEIRNCRLDHANRDSPI